MKKTCPIKMNLRHKNVKFLRYVKQNLPTYPWPPRTVSVLAMHSVYYDLHMYISINIALFNCCNLNN